jgi:hypothetical protein
VSIASLMRPSLWGYFVEISARAAAAAPQPGLCFGCFRCYFFPHFGFFACFLPCLVAFGFLPCLVAFGFLHFAGG